jgi:hypothetical protein
MLHDCDVMHIFPTLFIVSIMSRLTDPYLLNNRSIVTRLRAWRPGNRGLISRGTRDFSALQRAETGSGVQPASCLTGIGGCFPGGGGGGGGGDVKWSTHLHLMPRLRSSGAVNSTSQYALMASTESALLLPVSCEERYVWATPPSPPYTQFYPISCTFVFPNSSASREIIFFGQRQSVSSEYVAWLSQLFIYL